MMERLETRGRRLGARRAATVAAQLGEAAGAALPGVEVTAEAERVVLSARGLGRRWLRDPALRWLGGLVR